MGLILLVFVFPVCVFVIVKRRGRHMRVIVPVVLATYSLLAAASTMLGIIHALAGLASVDPSMKATLLAKGVSEFLNSTAFWLIIHIPLLVGAYFLDRRLRAQPAIVT